MLKAFIGILGVTGAAYYFTTDHGYNRTVGASQEQVAASLAGADIRDAPGAPGTDSMRSANLPSMFAVSREGNDVVWTVTNGGETAVRMIAHLAALDATHTKVTLDYERGDAPDDHVAPAFRSRGTTLGLLSMVVEEKLDALTMPAGEWTAKCDEIMANWEAGNGPMREPGSLTAAMGNTARQGMRLAALDKELKAAGCPQNQNNGAFKPVESQLGDGPSAPVIDDSGRQEGQGAQYAAGKPMIDTSR